MNRIILLYCSQRHYRDITDLPFGLLRVYQTKSVKIFPIMDSVTPQIKTYCSEDFFINQIHSWTLKMLLFTLIHTCPLCALFPAATGWHVRLAWWSAGFFEGLQSGTISGSRHLPLLSCTPAVRSMRAQREHGGVRENTNRATIVPDLSSTPHGPTSRDLRLREWATVNGVLQIRSFFHFRWVYSDVWGKIALLCSLWVSLPFLSYSGLYMRKPFVMHPKERLSC